MERKEQGDVDILVHVSAPSRGTDDARYRAQAQAYLDFKPVTKQILQRNADEGNGYSQPQLANQVLIEATLSTQEERESRASYRPSDDDGERRNSASMASFQSTNLEDTGERSQFLDSPELSFNSVLDNIGSPAFRGGVTRPTTRSQEQNTQVSFASPWGHSRSFISNSQSDPQNNNPAISPAGVLEQYMQRIRESESRVQNQGEIEQSVSGSQSGRGIVSSNGVAAVVSLTSSSELPSSPSPDKSIQAGRYLHVRHAGRNTTSAYDFATPSTTIKKPGDSSPSLSAPLNSSGNSLPPLAPVTWPPHQQQAAPPTSSLVSMSVATTSSNFNYKPNPANPTNAIITTSTPIPPSTKWDTIHEIRPNPPPTSTNDLTPSMLITPELQKLAARMSLATRFRPVSQSRELRPMERGYWDVDFSSLVPELRRNCWSYLGDFISRDLAGWGVWAVRTAGESQSEGNREDLDQEKEYTKIRIYCWGIIAGHIYLLLYLASEGKIKGTGACWRGGDGNVIIEMPGL